MHDPQRVADNFRDCRQECADEVLHLAQANGLAGGHLSRLRNQFGDALAGLMVDAASLQRKAKRKHLDPSVFQASSFSNFVWWTTTRSFQQSTAWQVAKLKASWCGNEPVVDLCCSVGGDSIALAHRGNLIAIDRDPIMAAFAEANLDQCPATFDWDVRCGDVNDEVGVAGQHLHVDPDRREGDRRSTGVEAFSPDWQDLVSIIKPAASAVIKLAPATELNADQLIQIGSECPVHRCWISLQGTVRDQTLIIGDAVNHVQVNGQDRSAIAIGIDGNWARYLPDVQSKNHEPGIAKASKLGIWMIDPNSAIRAAGLTETFAAENSLMTLGGLAGFLTTDQDVVNEKMQRLAIVGRVVWAGSADDRKLRRELRAHDWFPETIKCRATDHDPASLFRRYRRCGDQPVTLWIGRSAKRTYAAITVPA